MTKIRHIRSLRDIKNVSRARIYSIPKQQRSVHLDLHVLDQEKKRLKKELSQLQMKIRLIKKRLAQNNKRMNELKAIIRSHPCPSVAEITRKIIGKRNAENRKKLRA